MREGQIILRLAALAHPTRLRAFRLLVQAGPDGVASGIIARRLAIPATTMSTHLSVLARSGLINARRESRLVYYSLAPEAVRAVIEALIVDCCDGKPELCAPRIPAQTKASAAKSRSTRR